ncbi:MAG: hypothetical protein GY805_17645, partial [Chloroflexi bacterium]|nr:hypothetical protein [Chloroflexota bacterium]
MNNKPYSFLPQRTESKKKEKKNFELFTLLAVNKKLPIVAILGLGLFALSFLMLMPRLAAAAPPSRPIVARNGRFGLQITPTVTITPTATLTPSATATPSST